MANPSRRSFPATGLATGLAVGAASGLAACQPVQTVKAASDAGGTTVEVEGVPIHLARSGQGRPLVLIHGASGNLNDMTFRLGPALADRFEVIAVDRPGHGRSGIPAGGDVPITTQARLIRGALARIGIDRALVVGHSYGGSVALAWAVDAPGSVSALVLLGAPSQVWEGGLGLTNDLLASAVIGPALASALPHLVTEGFATRTLATVFAPQPAPPGYLAHLDLGLVLQPASLRENARQLVGLKEEIRPLVPAYPRLAMPIELVHGDADRTVGLDIHSRPFARQVPQAELVVLPGVGHMLHQVATAEVAARIRATARRTAG
ncbi:MAG: alpha/beta hydrolase [Amaricoccus sp.]|uniref:alpha/beta fold hydrolase n=1 Tax=Amaricoccus sp. TaxID=1872485 RepID=UPI0039E5F08B